VDYVFLTMKVSGYDSNILDTIAPLVGPETAILPPTTSIPYWWFYKFGGDREDVRLPQVDPDDKLWSALPPEKVIGFTMWLSAVQTAPGRTVLRHVQRGYPLGELDGSRSRRVERLAAALERGGVPAPQVSNIRSEIFIKSINSLAFNIMALLGDSVNGVIASVPEAVETLREVMEECEGMAHAMGIPIHQSAEDRIQQTLSAHMHTMSMLHDLRSGKKLELRPLWESICDLAKATGVQLPLSTALVSCAFLREKAEIIRNQSSQAAEAIQK
jgi:2-dehydropantoate 2-reductase